MSCPFLGGEGRSVSGRGFQAQDTHQEQGGEEEPGGGGRFLEQNDAGDQGPQGADFPSRWRRRSPAGAPWWPGRERAKLTIIPTMVKTENFRSVNPWENFMQVDQNTSITPAMHK